MDDDTFSTANMFGSSSSNSSNSSSPRSDEAMINRVEYAVRLGGALGRTGTIPPNATYPTRRRRGRQSLYDASMIPPRPASAGSSSQRSSAQEIPLWTRVQTLERYQTELASLNGHWMSICIALHSIRSSYLAVMSTPSLASSDQRGPVPVSSTSTPPSLASFSAHANSPLLDFLLPSSVAVSSFVASRRNSTVPSDVEQELLLAVDDAMFQIRQLEGRIERLELLIQDLIQSITPDY